MVRNSPTGAPARETPPAARGALWPRAARILFSAGCVVGLSSAWAAQHRTELVRQIRRNQAFQSDALPLLRERLARGGAPKILFVGDSVVQGSYVVDSQTLPAYFDGLLGTLPATRRCEAVNGGITGAQIGDRCNVLDYMLPAHPKLIVMSLNLHMMEARASFYVPGAALSPGPIHRLTGLVEYHLQRHWPLYELRGPIAVGLLGTTPDKLLWDEQSHTFATNDDSVAAGYHWTARDIGPAMSELRGALARCREAGVSVFTFVSPVNVPYVVHHFAVKPREAQARMEAVRREVERWGVPCANLLLHFRENEFVDREHLRPAGNRRLAAILLQEIQRRMPTVLDREEVAARQGPRRAHTHG